MVHHVARSASQLPYTPNPPDDDYRSCASRAPLDTFVSLDLPAAGREPGLLEFLATTHACRQSMWRVYVMRHEEPAWPTVTIPQTRSVWRHRAGRSTTMTDTGRSSRIDC